jgi:hypothetical protein
MRNAPSNNDDVIDSRDIIARIEELQDMGANERRIEHPDLEPSEDDAEELRELDALRSLQEEAEGYTSDWEYGATLIRESYFEDYCQEMLEDIGDLPKDLPGYLVIDWEATADNLRVDYTEVDFDGVAYLVR